MDGDPATTSTPKSPLLDNEDTSNSASSSVHSTPADSTPDSAPVSAVVAIDRPRSPLGPAINDAATDISTVGPGAWAFLSDHIVKDIFHYLSHKDQLQARQVCRPWSDMGRHLVQCMIADHITVDATTIARDDRIDYSEWEHLGPVLARVDSDEWYLPENRVVFEPNYPSHYRYRRNQYTPSELTIRIPGRMPYKWDLDPPLRSSQYDRMDPEWNSREIQLGRFIRFDYFHERDMWRKYALRVFYKSDEEDGLRLHAVAIPLNVLEIITGNHGGNHHN
jgi:hypothetical protein